MSADTAVRLRLLAVTALTALVNQRIYVVKLPQSPVYPCIRVTLIPGFRIPQHLRGPEGTRTVRVQVDCFAGEQSGGDPYARANDCDAAALGDGLGPTASGLFGWVGRVENTAVSPVDALQVNWVGAEEAFPHYEADEKRLVAVTRDYFVNYRQAA